MNWTFAVFIAVLLVANTAASVIVIRNASLSVSQRMVQLALAWLIPIVGAVLCLAFRATADQEGSLLDRQAFVDNAGVGAPLEPLPDASLWGGDGDASGGDGGGGD